MTSVILIQDELSTALSLVDGAGLAQLGYAFADRARRWFVSGQGRSRLVACMAAMRLMHIGFDVYVTGEVSAPAIGELDRLLMVSASGTAILV